MSVEVLIDAEIMNHDEIHGDDKNGWQRSIEKAKPEMTFYPTN